MTVAQRMLGFLKSELRDRERELIKMGASVGEIAAMVVTLEGLIEQDTKCQEGGAK